MSINQKLEDLYQMWRKPNEHFVSCGVVDEAIYEATDVKMMMLLKEVNDEEQKDNWSLVDFIRAQIDNEANHKPVYPTWKRVGEWSFGLQNDFPFYEQIISGPSNISEGLSAIATTNLKKSGGAGFSHFEEIRQHAFADKELWTSEIEIIRPNLVVCGGTYPIVQEVLRFQSEKCGSGVQYGRALNTIFIDFYHPQYRVSPKLLYSYFKETMISLGF